MILILRKGTALAKKNRLLNYTRPIAFTISIVVNLVFVAFLLPLISEIRRKGDTGGWVYCSCPPDIEDP